MKKILLAVDGSKHSDQALLKAKQIGIAFNSEITILYVIENIPSYSYVNSGVDIGVDIASLWKIFKELGEKILEEALEKFKDYNGKVDTLIKSGNPGSEIIKVAEEGDHSLIIMGSEGLGTISRVLLGSVSNKVVNGAKTSVLIVK